jgi:hypothetical protein
MSAGKVSPADGLGAMRLACRVMGSDVTPGGVAGRFREHPQFERVS